MDRGTGFAEPQPKGAEGSGLSLGTVWAALRRSPWLVLAVAAAAAAAGAAVWVFLPLPKMTGYALFQIHSSQPHILNPSDRSDFNLFRQSQAAMVKNRVLLNAALRDEAVRGASMLQGDDRLSALESRLKVDFKSGPEFMRVSIEGDNEAELRAVIAAVANAYLDDVVNKKKNQSKERRDKLLKYDSELQAGIQQTSNQLTSRMETLGAGSAEDERDRLRAEKMDLTQRKLQADSQLREHQIELDALKNPNRKRVVSEAVTGPAVRQQLEADPKYLADRVRCDQLRVQIKVTRERLAPGKTTDQLKSDEKELQELAEGCGKKEEQARRDVEALALKLAEQADQVDVSRLQNKVQFYQQLGAILEKDIRDLGLRGTGVSANSYDIERWRGKLARDRDLHARTQSELLALQLESEAPDRVTKLEVDVMSGIEGTRRVKFAGMAALGIGVVGLGVLVWRESRNPRVLSSTQLPGELGLPLIGVLPPLRPTNRAAPADDPNWQVALGEAVSAARTILQYGVSGPRPARSILVGSALSGEGKTSAALLLARSLAQAGHRTLLIDGDLRHPRLHQALGLPGRAGLCEYLAGTASPTEILQPTGVPELTAVAAGQWSAAGNQGLTTGRWTELVTQAAEQYEYVIIDSAPILPVADTLVMARAVDGVLLSVMRDVSELSAVKETLAQLALIGTRVLGVVMNGGYPAGYYRPRYGAETPAVAPAPAGVS